jgi:hypothetical protein
LRSRSTRIVSTTTFPATEQGPGIAANVSVAAEPPQNWKGPYLRDSSVPMDPWGRPCVYVSPGIARPRRTTSTRWAKMGNGRRWRRRHLLLEWACAAVEGTRMDRVRISGGIAQRLLRSRHG